MLIVPGAAGEIGVLARHAPLVATLKAGSTRVHLGGGEVLELATGSGFFKVELDRAIALVDDAIDVRRSTTRGRRSSSRRRRPSWRRSSAASRPPTAGSSSSGSSTPKTSSRSRAVPRGMKATVAEKREVAKGTLLALFEVDDYPDYRPGAYFWVELPDRGHEDEKGLRRHISLVTSPTERPSGRARDAAPRQRLQAHAGGAGGRRRGRGRGAEGLVPAARGHERRLRLRRRRDRDHRLPLDAPLHRRRELAVPRHARLLEPRPRVGGVPGRARGAGAADRGPAGRPDDDRRRRLGGREPADRRRVLREHVGDLEDKQFLVAGPPAMAEAVVESLLAAGVPEDQVWPASFCGY